MNLFLNRTALVMMMLLYLTPSLRADSLSILRKRKIYSGSATTLLYAGSVIGLHQAWYKNYSSGSFHFFNDNREWLQMDKAGHLMFTYTVSETGISVTKWAGCSERTIAWLGGMSGCLYMSTIEIMDGFSSGWGFSWGDMAANICGSALATLQYRYWKGQRIRLKFSFHSTTYPQYRPNLLGNSISEQWLKDYNGQSYWLSVNPSAFMKTNCHFPKWLNIAIGYGAEGMISGEPGYVILKADGTVVGNNLYRKLILSLDIDLSRIKTKSAWFNRALKALNFIKIPMPSIVFTPKGAKGYYLFY